MSGPKFTVTISIPGTSFKSTRRTKVLLNKDKSSEEIAEELARDFEYGLARWIDTIRRDTVLDEWQDTYIKLVTSMDNKGNETVRE